MDFDRLDRILKEQHMSRRALALAVGINENKMSSAYKRRSGLSSADVLKIAEYLGVSPYWLDGWTEKQKKEEHPLEQIMARLVYPHANGEYKLTKQGHTRYWSPATKFDLMNRLGEYEDLGYTPDELREMIREIRKASGEGARK